MTKFVVVEEKPKTLAKGEYVISMPDFLEEIAANKSKAQVMKLTAVNHLRSIAASVGQKYDPEHFNAFAHIKPSLFEGIAYETDEDLSKIVTSMFKSCYPSIFEKAIEYEIQARPMGVKAIYFVGPWDYSGPFTKNGIDLATQEEVEVEMGRKEKKTVGKPIPKGSKALDEDSSQV